MYKSPITIEALQVLDTIDRRGSFAAAAEQLNKVPSALSYIVQKLEEQLAVTLFVRQGRRSVLTPAGRHLLEEGRKVLSAVSKLTEQTQTISHGWEPKINITFDSLFDMQLLLKPLAQFLHEHPNIEVDMNEEVMHGSWEALIEDRTDLVIAAPDPIPHQQGISVTALGNLQKIFVVPK
ncbi:MAG: LysR family transcriptional regulator, partial [Moritella sp.]|uniref:LysR family transcriptional regulator n=1 Tax=Moritella sp. TaxID=78556 RepID=UPI001DB2BC8B